MKKVTGQQGKQMLELLEGMETEEVWNEPANSLDTDEMVKLLTKLRCYNVLPPDENKINNTIKEIGVYHQNLGMPGMQHAVSACTGLLKKIVLTLQYLSKWHIIASVLIYIAAFCFVSLNATGINPYTLIIALAPVPFILGLADIIRSFQTGMQELEMSFRINSWQFMLLKLLIICILNIILNVIFTALFAGMNNGISIWKMSIYWCSPFFVICSMSLFLVFMLRDYFVQSIFIALWTAIVIILLSEPKFEQWLISLNTAVYIAVMLTAALLLILEIYCLIIRNGNRGVFFETYNGKYI